MSISPRSIPVAIAVLMLSPEESRYVDPSDGQLPGYNAASRFHYCSECETNWLKGPGPIPECPSHDQFFNATAGHTKRTMVVHSDGACPGNGINASTSSIGVYFGPDSSHNISRLLTEIVGTRPTNQVAELTAAIAALRRVREDVLPQRKAKVYSHPPGNDQFYVPHIWPNGITSSEEDCLHDLWKFKLIVATDSAYVVECLCLHRANWFHNQVTNVYYKTNGDPIKNNDLFVQLFWEIELLARGGIQVQWYHVLRRYNQAADDLANDALNLAAFERGARNRGLYGLNLEHLNPEQ